MGSRFFAWLRRDKAGHQRAEEADKRANQSVNAYQILMQSDQERIGIFRRWRIENHLGEAWEMALRERR